MRYVYPYGVEIALSVGSIAWFLFAFFNSDWIGIASAAALATLTVNLVREDA